MSIAAGCGIALLILFGLAYHGGGIDPDAPLPLPAGGTELIVRKGDSFRQISGKLVAAGLLNNRRPFARLARREHTTGKMQPGIYPLRPPLTLRQLHNRLVQGEPVRLAIPEGFTLGEIARRLEELRLVESPRSFLVLARSPQWIKRQFAIDAQTLEGLLWPDTYFIAPGESAAEIIVRMVQRFLRQSAALGADFHADPRRAYQILILASMIEKEAALPAERPLIASVYYNRLEKNMLLQCDATVRYGLNRWKSGLTAADLRADSPWNTYLHKGLPPTPICSPGRDALQAALQPARSDFLFYSAKGDDSHAFARTNAEHNENVRKYLRNRKDY